MKLPDAVRKAKNQRFAGWIISIPSFVLFVTGLLKSLYFQNAGVPFLGPLIRSCVYWLYQKTIWLDPLWGFAPQFYFPDVFTGRNLGFVAVLMAFILGCVIRDSGIRLLQRIYRVEQRAEETLWERSLTGDSERRDITSVEITLQAGDTWYTRPIGIILLAIISGILVNYLSKLVGF